MMSRKFVIGSLLILLTTTSAVAQMSAREIMQAVDDRDDGDNATANMTMSLIDKKGDQRVRQIHRFSKDKGEDQQSLIFFISPADVEDTAFLTYDYDEPNVDDDQWLYLPALRKSKRIASSDRSGSFMGSDFNYSDMTRRNLEAYDYKILKDDAEAHGAKSWLIEAVPKSQEEIDETGYTKSLLFVRQDNFVVVRAVHWTNDKKLKYLDVDGLEQIDGIWTNTSMSMTTKKGKQTLHRTELKYTNIRYNQDLDAEMFTVRRMEKGL